MVEAPFLFACAAVNMSLAGLAGLIVGLRRVGEQAAVDLFRLRQIVEFGFANALLALIPIPMADSLGSAASAVRASGVVALTFIVVDVVLLLVRARRWAVPLGRGMLVLATALVLAAGVLATTAITLGSIVGYEWMLVVLIARPMFALLLVFATIRPDHG